MRRAEQRLEVLGIGGLRQEGEDPAAIVVEQRRSSVSGRSAWRRAGRSGRGRSEMSPSTSTTGSLAGGGHAQRGRDQAVDAVGAAVAQHAAAVAARPARNVSQSRIGMLLPTKIVAPAGSSAASSAKTRPSNSSSMLRSAAGQRGARRDAVPLASQCSPSDQLWASQAGAAPSSRSISGAASAWTIWLAAQLGSFQPPASSTTICAACGMGLELQEQWLGGRHRAEAQHHLGRQRAHAGRRRAGRHRSYRRPGR